MSDINISYKIATLVFVHNQSNEQLLIHRNQSPNKDLWIPIGGKLETSIGESPVECAIREANEEAGLTIQASDLHLFGYLAESNHEGSGHWLIFLFHCKRPILELPNPISEGTFGFHSLESINALKTPPSDRDIVWPVFKNNRNGFTGIRIQYLDPDTPEAFEYKIEQEIKIPL